MCVCNGVSPVDMFMHSLYMYVYRHLQGVLVMTSAVLLWDALRMPRIPLYCALPPKDGIVPSGQDDIIRFIQ